MADGLNDTNDASEVIITASIRGPATIRKRFSGRMALTGTNTFTGPVEVEAGELRVSNPASLGTSESGVTVSSSGTLSFSGGISVLNEPLALQTQNSLNPATLLNHSGSNTWSGPITLSRDTSIHVETNSSLNLRGVINGSGNVAKGGPGPLTFSGAQANTYAGATTVNQGELTLAKSGSQHAVPGELIIGDGVGGASADVVLSLSGNQINNQARVTVNDSGLLLTGGQVIGSLVGAGLVELSALTSILQVGADNTSAEFGGVIRGPGGLRKIGTGTLTLNGDNTYESFTAVVEGQLRIDGQVRRSQVNVKTNALLSGQGRVELLVAEAGGTVAPGSSVGTLFSGELFLDRTSIYAVELNGPYGQNDQVSVRGSVVIQDAVLRVAPGYAPAEGEEHIIVRNDGIDPVNGAFRGLPEGATLTTNGVQLVVSYQGGTGNDVTLTATNLALKADNALVQGGNGNGQVDPNECNLLFLTISNRFDEPVTGIHAALDTITYGVAITGAESAYPDVPPQTSAQNLRPFQLRPLTNFNCGQPVQLRLTLTTTSHGPLAMSFSLPTGPVCIDGGGGCASCLAVVSGTLSTNGPRLAKMLNADTLPGQCGAPNTCSRPRELPAPGLLFNTHTFTNDGPDTCATVLLHAGCSGAKTLFYAAAYLNAFDPSDLCANYLGEIGGNVEGGGPHAFSFPVPTGARFIVAVNAFPQEGGGLVPACANYTLELFGLPCPPPTLRIAPTAQPDKVRLHWPTSAAGFHLESAPDVNGAGEFVPVPTPPVVVNGQFTVTHSLPHGREFFRLAKP